MIENEPEALLRYREGQKILRYTILSDTNSWQEAYEC